MKTNKNISDNKLSELFREIQFENPSPDFMGKLMRKVEKEAISEKRKQQWITAGQIAAGISCMLILPALVIYLCMIFIPDFSFTVPKIHLRFDPNFIVIGLSVLMLLIIDTLFRTHSANRKKEDFK
jgi:hypothetical protein